MNEHEKSLLLGSQKLAKLFKECQEEAKARGLTQEKLDEILAEEETQSGEAWEQLENMLAEGLGQVKNGEVTEKTCTEIADEVIAKRLNNPEKPSPEMLEALRELDEGRGKRYKSVEELKQEWEDEDKK